MATPFRSSIPGSLFYNTATQKQQSVTVGHGEAHPLLCFRLLPDHHILMFCQASFALYLIKLPFGAASRCSEPFLMCYQSFGVCGSRVFLLTRTIMTVCEAWHDSEWCKRHLWAFLFLIERLQSVYDTLLYKVITFAFNINRHSMFDNKWNHLLSYVLAWKKKKCRLS